LKTDDAHHWYKQVSNTDNALLSVSAIDSRHAWAVGGNAIVGTENGGQTWKPSIVMFEDRIASLELSSVSATRSAIWVTCASAPLVFKSTNGGHTWTVGGFGRQLSVSVTRINSISALDNNIAWIAGRNGDIAECFIAKTVNGGISWNIEHCHENGQLRAIQALDKNTAWAVGETRVKAAADVGEVNGALILKTANGGRTWETKKTMSKHLQTATDVAAVDSNVAIVVIGLREYSEEDDHENSSATLQLTTDGGDNWSSVPMSNLECWEYPSIAAVNRKCLALAGAGVASTNNGGSSWNTHSMVVKAATPSDALVFLRHIYQ